MGVLADLIRDVNATLRPRHDPDLYAIAHQVDELEKDRDSHRDANVVLAEQSLDYRNRLVRAEQKIERVETTLDLYDPMNLTVIGQAVRAALKEET